MVRSTAPPTSMRRHLKFLPFVVKPSISMPTERKRFFASATMLELAHFASTLCTQDAKVKQCLLQQVRLRATTGLKHEVQSVHEETSDHTVQPSQMSPKMSKPMELETLYIRGQEDRGESENFTQKPNIRIQMQASRHAHTHTHTHPCPVADETQTQTQTQAQRERHTDRHRHADTQTHRHTDTRRHTHTQTHRHTDTQTHRHTDTDEDTDTNTHTHTHAQTRTDTYTHTHTHTHPPTHTHTHTHPHTHTHAHPHTHTHTHTHTNTHTHAHTHTRMNVVKLTNPIVSKKIWRERKRIL